MTDWLPTLAELLQGDPSQIGIAVALLVAGIVLGTWVTRRFGKRAEEASASQPDLPGSG